MVQQCSEFLFEKCASELRGDDDYYYDRFNGARAFYNAAAVAIKAEFTILIIIFPSLMRWYFFLSFFIPCEINVLIESAAAAVEPILLRNSQSGARLWKIFTFCKIRFL